MRIIWRLLQTSLILQALAGAYKMTMILLFLAASFAQEIMTVEPVPEEPAMYQVQPEQTPSPKNEDYLQSGLRMMDPFLRFFQDFWLQEVQD